MSGESETAGISLFLLALQVHHVSAYQPLGPVGDQGQPIASF